MPYYFLVIQDFLQKHGYSVVEVLPQDASPRSYTRVKKGGHTALLMDCRHEYPDRPGLAEFLKIAAWLRSVDVSAPEVYEVDEQAKLLLLEDFGSVSFKAALNQGVSEERLYALAVELLDHLQMQEAPNFLPRYHDTRVHDLRRDLIDTWLPAVRGEDNPPGLTQAYLSVWDEIERGLPPVEQTFQHMDYHLENLIYLPDRTGVLQCGLIDFQDASVGPAPYDFANILENVRQTVSPDIKNQTLSERNEAFLLWYRVLAAQWHGRVLGLFVRLGVHEGRKKYLAHIPRIYGYMQESFKDPVLAPLKRFFDEISLDFGNINDFNDAT